MTSFSFEDINTQVLTPLTNTTELATLAEALSTVVASVGSNFFDRLLPASPLLRCVISDLGDEILDEVSETKDWFDEEGK